MEQAWPRRIHGPGTHPNNFERKVAAACPAASLVFVACLLAINATLIPLAINSAAFGLHLAARKVRGKAVRKERVEPVLTANMERTDVPGRVSSATDESKCDRCMTNMHSTAGE